MRKRTLVRAAAALAGPAIAVAVTAGDANALTGGPWTWQNTATLRCLDSNYSGSVYTLGCNGGNYQNWVQWAGPYGDFVKDNQTGLCLDGGNGLHTQACNGGAYQQWTWTYTGTYGWQAQNVATGYCLDSNAGGSAYTLGCNGGNFQRWK